jgi:hypothetical protein
MTRWEYKYIDLYQGNFSDPDAAFHGFEDAVRKAGTEGWEVVGEAGVSYQTPVRSSLSYVRVLVLKRPLG